MGRIPKVATRLSVAGAVALVAGSMMLVGVGIQALTSPAFADTSPVEMLCTGTPVGNIAINDVVLTGSLSPASPAPGQQFNLVNAQMSAPIPASVLQDAGDAGNVSLSGTITSTVDASGATPSSMSTGGLAYSTPIPNPVPASGVTLEIPSTPTTLGPFTATSGNITLSLAPTTSFDVQDGVIGPLALSCSAYPNDVLPSGLTNAIPPGTPISPVIASSGQAPPPPTEAVTGPYELYCPHTPVGDLVFNGVTTSATVASGLAAGATFQVTNYQTQIPLPAGVAQAAAGLGNSGFVGEAASAVDVYGASPDQASTGSMNFDVPIPNPVPSAGLGLAIPTTPMSVGPFTASGGPITIAQDQSMYVVAELSSKAFTMSCTAYPNDSVATSGSTGTAPTGPAMRPIIALASASGTTSTSPSTTTTTIFPYTPSTIPPGSPYELYCPQTPVGNLVLNDTTTSGTISPSTLKEGDQFDLSSLQTQFSIPQAVAQQAETLGMTQLTGDMSVFLDASGVYGFDDGFGGGGFLVSSVGPTTAVAESSGGPAVIEPYPGPYPVGDLDMHFDVTLPNPVPAGGVQFTATPPAGSNEYFTAEGGPIQLAIGEVNLDVSEFGDNFGLFCTTFPNDTQPTGLSTTFPEVAPAEPVIATGSATLPPPTQGNQGPYELFCPNTPIGDVAFNNVTSTATLSPADPATGTQFNVTGYQSTVTIPPSIASALTAIGNVAVTGTVTSAIDVSGATPSSISTGAMSFDTPIPATIPPTGLQLTVPSPAASIGPFTSTGGGIVVTQDAMVQLSVQDAGVNLSLDCETYPNNTEPTGIVGDGPPPQPPTEPVLALGDGATLPPPPSTTGAYELYCPGTPVGNIALNDVTTSGSITPADPSSGEQFTVTGYQSQVSLPTQIVTAAAALGNTAILGSATGAVDVTGASPATLSTGAMDIDAPIPSPVPSAGLVLDLPLSPGTVGPFTATGGTITVTQDPSVTLVLNVSGSNLTLTCRAYPNDTVATGIVTAAPTATPVSPTIATTATTPPVTTPETLPPDGDTTAPPTTVPGSEPTVIPPETTTPVSPTTGPYTTTPVSPTSTPGTTTPVSPTSSDSTPGTTTAPVVDAAGGTTTPTTGAPGTTPTTSGADPSTTADPAASQDSTAPVVSASSGDLAFTGPGPQIRWIVLAGTALVLIGLAMLVLVDAPRPRGAVAGAAHRAPCRAPRRATRRPLVPRRMSRP